MRAPIRLALIVLTAAIAHPHRARAQDQWTEADTRRVVDNVAVLRLDPDLSHLSPGERTVVDRLLEVGRIFQELYEDQNHPDAIWARANIEPESDQAILHRLYQGPIATNVANRRVPFLEVRPELPGRNVYPLDLATGGLDAYLAAHATERADLLDVRTVVRRATEANVLADAATLEASPWLRVLHPE